jgi:hypothetical protein
MIPIDAREALLTIIENISGHQRKGIVNSTRLYHDLFIAGDDATELIDKIHDVFGTAFEKFVFDRFFPDEETAMYYMWSARLGYKGKRWVELTFGHLVSVVENGQWFEPDG